ncbi:MAG: NAD(P)H-binding protein [Rhodospirillaceae bacterium]|nr:NAD(P)H-binding protein [Rhodospirillaceae bacterium]
MRAAKLDWTILWPAFLTNRPMRAAPLLTAEGRGGGTTSRQAVADVAVRCLASDNAIGRTLIVVDPAMGFTLRGSPRFELDVPWQAWPAPSPGA